MPASREFAADGESVSAARSFAQSALGDLDLVDLKWPVAQVVSELATNAVIHAHTAFVVTLSATGDGVRIEVRDSSPRPVQFRSYGADATTGRGLRMVRSLSRACGADVDNDGKTVWAEIDANTEPDTEALLASFLAEVTAL